MADIPCPHCNGTGRINTDPCIAVVNTRRCKRRPLHSILHPVYESAESEERIRLMCAFHQNKIHQWGGYVETPEGLRPPPHEDD
jgi:DnaJ-class molecular chaperone